MNGKRWIIKKQTKAKANQMAYASPLKLIISQNSLTSWTQKDMLDCENFASHVASTNWSE
jgi:hypothetical protein